MTMTMTLAIAAALFVLAGVTARARRLSVALACAGALASLAVAVGVLATGPLSVLSWTFAQGLAIGVRVDHVSAIFLAVSSIGWLAVLLSAPRAGATPRELLGLSFAIVGMLLVLCAQDVILFLTGWEVMTIFTYILIVHQNEDSSAAFRFLAFGELSSVLLLAGFAVRYLMAGTFSLNGPSVAAPLFVVFASLGCIVKMDVAPFHAWMQRVYPRLNGYVASFTSAGITLIAAYGLFRVIGDSAYVRWWMLVLALWGALSAFWGALQASVTRYIRMVPGYSTVEYQGMVVCALALSVVAGAGAGTSLQYLGVFAGAAAVILIVSHTLSKSLFFVSLGALADRPFIATFDGHEGGIAADRRSFVRRASVLGIVVAALSFAAFPPLIGYVGDWMLLETTFQAYFLAAFSERLIASLAGIFVALGIGMTAFAMVRFVGYFVLDTRRAQDGRSAAGAGGSHGVGGAHVAEGSLAATVSDAKGYPTAAAGAPDIGEISQGRGTVVAPDPGPAPGPGPIARGGRTAAIAVIGLAVLVAAGGIGVPLLLQAFGFGGLLSGLLAVPSPLLLVSGKPLFGVVSPTFFACIMAILSGVPLLVWLTRRSRVRAVEPWGGGLPEQAGEHFTATAFAQILAYVFRRPLGTHERSNGILKTFAVSDWNESIFSALGTAVEAVGRVLSRLYMNGRIGWYVVYIMVAFVIALVIAAVHA